MIVIAMAGVFWTQRILNLSDGMLYQMLKVADPITDKVLHHTHKKYNKRNKGKKKRPRRARQFFDILQRGLQEIWCLQQSVAYSVYTYQKNKYFLEKNEQKA